jgi:hypothetical protein
LRQGQEEGVDGLVGGEVGGVDGEVGEAAVEGMAFGEAELSGGGIFEDGASNVLQHAAVEEGGEGCVEEDGEGGGGLFEEEAVGEAFRSASAEGYDRGAMGEGGGEGGGFEAAEAGFAVEGEDLGDGGSSALLEMGIEIEEGPADAVGEEASYGGLARSHEAGEDQALEVGGDGGVGGFRFDGGLGGDHLLSPIYCYAFPVA